MHTVLANAFKYTRKGSVSVDVSTNADRSVITLRVTDTGATARGTVRARCALLVALPARACWLAAAPVVPLGAWGSARLRSTPREAPSLVC